MATYLFARSYAGFRAFVVAICITLGSGFLFQGIGQGATLEARYDPDTGNITMIAVDGNGDPVSMAVLAFQFLSPPPTEKLTGEAANIPSGANFSISNDSSGGVYSQAGSEIYATNFPQSDALFNDSWNLGNVAMKGMSLSDVTASFTTSGASTPGGQPVAGSYLYWVVGASGYSVAAITVVPEPTGAALTAGGLCCVAAARRTFRRGRRKC